MKTCAKCKRSLHLSDFYMDARRKDGRRGRCKRCEGGYSSPLEAEVRRELRIPAAAAFEICAATDYQKAPDGAAAVEFAEAHPGFHMSWMHVPANGDWHALRLSAIAEGISVYLKIGGGFTLREARLLQERLQRVENPDEFGDPPPAPMAYADAHRSFAGAS